ncbi:Flagellar hook-associated protein 2 [Paenibacillus plantiphilus]|uniref:Flagellar hook-associated protein 2 n=1 Tax=Paenibacillus plantiphilus TaxID=2905650 RepID=A0ABN8FVB2_9BACL|nr:flagellar filament capping protein FliD [Paenibacillus plantiphilus]CAH1192969.1 Flagellar hook-associated protein 2 [Paenibacillus plantiphilus]
MSVSFPGLASNLDTAAIINKLMEFDRIPYDRLDKKKGDLGAEQTIFQTVNTKLGVLQSAVSDLMLNSNFNLVSGASSNEKVLKATASEGASTGDFNITVNTLAQSHAIKSGAVTIGDSTLKNKTFTIDRVGHTQITIDTSVAAAGATNGDILEYIKGQINSQDSGLAASIVSISATEKVLLISSKETGTANKMKLSGGTGGIELGGTSLADLGITNVDTAVNQTQAADNATITVNGVSITRSNNKISDVINGVTLDLLEAGSSKVTVSRDTDKVAGKIEKFINAYNDAVSLVRGNLTKPTDKTKMNPLQGDSVLKEISSKMYDIFTKVTGSPHGANMMSAYGFDIDKGIKVGSQMTGKITFDKEVFKEKFNADPNAVINMFNFKPSDGADAVEKSKEGIMRVLDGQLKEWTNSVNGLMTSKIKGYSSEITVIDERMEAMDLRLQMKQDQLKKQFASMEVALSKLKSQQSWLTSQLAALTPTKTS